METSTVPPRGPQLACPTVIRPGARVGVVSSGPIPSRTCFGARIAHPPQVPPRPVGAAAVHTP
eukprot:1674423-Pyramimonas_sp.AAC.1